ncbi:MAG: exopolyphosphatase, partial [Rhodocyclaceae bacterium]|nr:exopolyphosphatase [Rhodocyclaceae bacterium]
PTQRFLQWAAALHEIGISVAHAGFHKHSAYIVANADMPGFSRMEQARLAALILAHRGKLVRALSVGVRGEDWSLLICLRLAVLLHRARARTHGPLPVRLARGKTGFTLSVPAAWLHRLPLTAAALEEEQRYWEGVSQRLEIVTVATGAASGAERT